MTYAAAVLIYFLAMADGGLRAGITTDDIYNLSAHCNQTAGAILKSIVLYFSPAYRPLGSLFYCPIFGLFGLNPAPYRAICFFLLAVNIGIMACFVRVVTQSSGVMLTATLIGCFHPRFVELYWNTGTIYEILCCGFFYGALWCYVRLRRSEARVPLWQWVVVLALYLAALDAKEMAVAIPLLMLAYEAIYMAGGLRASLRRWYPALTATLMAIPYVIGKMSAASPLAQFERYRPELSFERLVSTAGTYFGNLFYTRPWPPPAVASAVGGALLLAALLRSRHMLFAWCIAVISYMPIAFIVPRTAFVLYIPFLGVAMYVALVIHRITAIGRGSEPLRQAIIFAVLLILLLRAHRVQRHRMYGGLIYRQPAIRSILSELDRVKPQIPRGARILFLNDPLRQGDGIAVLLMRLYFRDQELEVTHEFERERPYDVIFNWQNGDLHVRR